MILVRHAQIYDGTGQKPFLRDVLSCTNIKNRIKTAPRKELYGSLRGAVMFYQRKNGSAHKEADPFFCTK